MCSTEQQQKQPQGAAAASPSALAAADTASSAEQKEQENAKELVRLMVSLLAPDNDSCCGAGGGETQLVPWCATREFYNQESSKIIAALRSSDAAALRTFTTYYGTSKSDILRVVDGSTLENLARCDNVEVLNFLVNELHLNLRDFPGECVIPRALYAAVTNHANRAAEWFITRGQMMYLPNFLVTANVQADLCRVSACSQIQSDSLLEALRVGNTAYAVKVIEQGYFTVAELTDTSRYRADWMSAAQYAVKLDNLPVVRAMILRGVDFSTTRMRDGDLAVEVAVCNGAREVLRELVTRYDLDLNVPCGDKKMLLLHQAFTCNQLVTFGTLLSLGARVTAKLSDGKTAILSLLLTAPNWIKYVAASLVFYPEVGNMTLAELNDDVLFPRITVNDKIKLISRGDDTYALVLARTRSYWKSTQPSATIDIDRSPLQ